MAEKKFSTPKLYIEHRPDHSSELDGNGVRQVHELPGHVYFGIEVDGVKIPLGRKATAGLEADIERAKSASQSDTSSE